MSHTLRMSSPHMHGGEVSAYQRELNDWFERWHVPHRIDVDADYGDQTREMHKLVCHGLGIDWRDGATPTVRRKIRQPERRNDHEKKIGAERAQWRHRLKSRYELPAGGEAALVVAYLEKFVGVSERPAGSNLGPNITEWEVLCGYNVAHSSKGVPWCGCFANAGRVAAGFASEPHFMGYCPAIEGHAKAGIGGWKWHAPNTDPGLGWLALFGAAEAVHVETVRIKSHPLRTIGGNTSKGDGSFNNGGLVAEHDFSVYHGMPLRGFADPNYR